MKKMISAGFVIALLISAGAIALWNTPATGQQETADQADPTDDKDQPGETDEPKQKEEDPPRKQRPLGKFMRAKLASADLVMEGLVTNDFELIKKGAIQMQVISAAEQWRVSNDPLYLHHSEDFRLILKGLRANAKDENLQGAALKYVELTMSCVECHRFVRDVLMIADFPAVPGKPGADRKRGVESAKP